MSLNWVSVQQRADCTAWAAWITRTDTDWEYTLAPTRNGWYILVVNSNHTFFLDTRSQLHITYPINNTCCVFPTCEDAKAAAERHQRLLVLV
jgi:hypothetical protein